MNPVSFGSVCSGIEAASVAWDQLGWKAAWLAEIEPWPARALHHHYGSGRPHYLPDPEAPGLNVADRKARRAAIKATAKLPLVPLDARTAPPNLGDMTRIAALVRAGLVPAPDVLAGGTPCQAYSLAGLRASLDDARGQLTLSFVDLANAIDSARSVRREPSVIVVWENVPGVLSTKDNAFGHFLAGLAGEDSALLPPGGGWPNAGCVFGPRRTVAWRVLDAQYFGVAQRRRRVFVVASAREGFDPAAVLFEFDGVRRDFAPSREARQDVAGTLSSRTTGGGGLGPDFECTGGVQPVAGTLTASFGRLLGQSGQDADHGHSHLVPLAYGGNNRSGAIEVATACLAHAGTHLDFESETFLVQPALSVALRGRDGGATAELGDEVVGCLRASTGGEDKAHVLAPIAFSSKDYGADACTDLSPTLRAAGHTSSHANAGAPPAVVYENGGAIWPDTMGMPHWPDCVQCGTDDIPDTLKAEDFDVSEDGTGLGQPISAQPFSSSGAGYWREGIGALRARPQDSHENVVAGGIAVRRLTPRECERLQAFPDDHTLIPVRRLGQARASVLARKGKAVARIGDDWWLMSADGPRYKALGNSMCVYNMRWIGRRIDRALGHVFTAERAA